MPKPLALAAAGLCVLLATACTPDNRPVADPVPAPSVTVAPRPTLTPTPRAARTTPTSTYTPPEDEYLLRNELYRAGQVAAVTCSLPTARLATKEPMIRYATAFVRCLDKAWAPVIEQAGFAFQPVSAVHSAPTGNVSLCGKMDEDVGAFYCGRDLGIYFNWPDYAVEDADWQEAGRTSVQYLMAHEYGHHVQQLTWMADEFDDRWAAAKPAAQQGEDDRNEMQAHCFAAAFFGANQKTLRLHGDRLAQFGHPGFTRSEIGDNFPRWLKQGFKAKGPGGCNTWAAPAGASKIN